MESIVGDNSEFDNEFLPEGTRPATDVETAQWLLNDGPVLKSTWMIYDLQFSDGQREIVASKFVRIKQNGPLPMPCRARRGESEKRSQNDEDSAKRARQAVRHRCKEIGADRMITLTYRENIQDIELVKRHWDLFRRRMGKVKVFHYTAVIERQKRGAFHMHVAVRGRQAYDVVRHAWQRVVGAGADGKPMGQAHVRNPNDFYKTRSRGCKKDNRGLEHLIAAYMTKYITKDMQDHELNKKRYWASRGVVIPEKISYQLPYGATMADAFAHVMQLGANHNNDGMVFFANSGLGCCYVATGPTRSSGSS